MVEAWCSGFDELVESVRETTPEWAAAICDLNPDDIRDSARLYARPSRVPSSGASRSTSKFRQGPLCLAGCDLMALCGNVDVPGGNILVHNAFEINAGLRVGRAPHAARMARQEAQQQLRPVHRRRRLRGPCELGRLLQAIEDGVPVSHQDDVDTVVQHAVVSDPGMLLVS